MFDMSTPPPSFSIDDVDVTEGDSGTVTATFTVTRSGESSDQVSVDYTTANGTAIAGTDYAAIPTTTLTFASGVTSIPVTVTISGDVDEEKDETFLVDLSNPVGGTISDGQGVGTIVDDDSPVVTVDGGFTGSLTGFPLPFFGVPEHYCRMAIRYRYNAVTFYRRSKSRGTE